MPDKPHEIAPFRSSFEQIDISRWDRIAAFGRQVISRFSRQPGVGFRTYPFVDDVQVERVDPIDAIYAEYAADRQAECDQLYDTLCQSIDVLVDRQASLSEARDYQEDVQFEEDCIYNGMKYAQATGEDLAGQVALVAAINFGLDRDDPINIFYHAGVDNLLGSQYLDEAESLKHRAFILDVMQRIEPGYDGSLVETGFLGVANAQPGESNSPITEADKKTLAEFHQPDPELDDRFDRFCRLVAMKEHSLN